MQQAYDEQIPRGRKRPLNAYQQSAHRAAGQKYREATELYASTDLPLQTICRQTGVSAKGFSAYIRRYHRDLLMKRNGIEVSDEMAVSLRLRSSGTGQTLPTHVRYREAIAACGDIRYIGYNVSQIAREFDLDATALANQLRAHYPDIPVLREKERMRRGVNDNLPRGARRYCVEQYAEAVEMLRTTDLTVPQVAKACNVSAGGLRQHLSFYHKDVIGLRAARRQAGLRTRKPGTRNGGGSVCGPKESTQERYRTAVELYRTTALTVSEIAMRTDVNSNTLQRYLSRWHRDLVLARRGIVAAADTDVDLSQTKHYQRSAAVKYAPAIDRLKHGGRSVAAAAAEFGLDPDNFRRYLKEHEPELAFRFSRAANPKKRQTPERKPAKLPNENQPNS